MDHNKNFIIVKDRHPRISEVLNDCVSLCVPTSRNESLASILQKLCAKLTKLREDLNNNVYVLEAGDGVTVTGNGSDESPWIVSSTSSVSHYSYTSADFALGGIILLDPLLDGKLFSLWLDAAGRFIYEDLGEWEYVAGGFRILIPGFDASVNDYHIELFIKPL